MTVDIKTIVCDKTHLPDLLSIMQPHTDMYGVDIVKSGLKELQQNTLKHILHNPYSPQKILATYTTDKLNSFAVYSPWPTLPVYTASFMYFAFEKQDLFNIRRHGYHLYDKMTKAGEEDNRFEFYYMVRDFNYDRITWMFELYPDVVPRYEAINIEYLLPGKISKYEAFNYTFNGIIGQQKKPVMIRKSQLKKEFRLPLC